MSEEFYQPLSSLDQSILQQEDVQREVFFLDDSLLLERLRTGNAWNVAFTSGEADVPQNYRGIPSVVSHMEEKRNGRITVGTTRACAVSEANKSVSSPAPNTAPL